MVRRASTGELVEQAAAAADAVLGDLDLPGDPVEALAILIGMSWRTLEQLRDVRSAAARELSGEQLRAALAPVRARVGHLIDTGRAHGRFRTDLTTEWFVTTIVDLMHGAALDVDAGRLSTDEAGWIVATTANQALSRPTG